MILKEDDVVFCEVKKIEGTTVFLEIENGMSGSMVLSEVAAGRIRNIRDYVAVGKKVVCKVLKVGDKDIELSLRRVTAKERQQVLERYKKERAFANILKLFGEDGDKVISRIKEDYDFSDFIEEIRNDSSILEKYIPKEKVKKFMQAVSEKVSGEKEVQGKILVKSFSENGLEEVKEVLNLPNIEIHYLGSSHFSIKSKGRDFKEARNNLHLVLQEIEKRAKSKKVIFEVLKEK